MRRYPRIRGLVQCLPFSQGALFRLGESVLPVRGSAAWEWYQAMRAPLENPSLHATELQSLADANPEVFKKMCAALQAAEMLHDVQSDSPELVPAALQKRFQAQIAQLELRSSQPLRVFAAMRGKRVLILTTSNLALALVDAALESGLGHVTLCSLDGGDAGYAGEICRDEANETLKAKVEMTSYQQCREGLNTASRFDYLIGAGITGQNWKILEEHLSPLLAFPGTSAFVVCLGPARVIAGNIEAAGKGGCLGCMEAYSAGAALERRGTPPLEISDVIGIGARLVIQHLWEVATAPAEDNSRHNIFECDLQTFSLQRRPRPEAHAACPRCRILPFWTNPSSWPFPRTSPPHAAFRELSQSAEQLYVDPRTGLIAELDEGHLLQYPMHQCAALLNPHFCHGETGWITEFGENMLIARVNAVRRALELSCERMLRRGRAPDGPVYGYSSDLECAETTRELLLPTGLVLSALRPEDLTGEAFYRVLAQYANSLDCWIERDPGLILSETAANHLFLHLQETGALRHVRIQECALAEQICVLRFLYDEEIISVAAGPDWQPVWATGLCDVWLKVTAGEAMQGRVLENRVRFRAAGPFPEPATLSRQIQATERAFRRKLIMVPLLDDGRLAALPLHFVCATLAESDRLQRQAAPPLHAEIVLTHSASANAAAASGRGRSKE
jgi:hypothetical protein